jgi:hypothetical protein
MKKGTALNSIAIELLLATLAFVATGKKATVINRATPMR